MVRLRVAGLYFNQVVAMVGEGSWTVRQVMDRYIEQRAADQPMLSYETERRGVAAAEQEPTVLAISVMHLTAPSSLSGTARRPGLYRLQENELDGGSTVLAWQYYIVANDGKGITRSATLPGGIFTAFGKHDPQQNGVQEGDAVIWRQVAIRRAPVDPVIAAALPGITV